MDRGPTSGCESPLVDDLGCIVLPTLAVHTVLHNAEGSSAETEDNVIFASPQL